MKHHTKRNVLLLASSSLLSAMPAGAANTFFHTGDLILFF